MDSFLDEGEIFAMAVYQVRSPSEYLKGRCAGNVFRRDGNNSRMEFGANEKNTHEFRGTGEEWSAWKRAWRKVLVTGNELGGEEPLLAACILITRHGPNWP